MLTKRISYNYTGEVDEVTFTFGIEDFLDSYAFYTKSADNYAIEISEDGVGYKIYKEDTLVYEYSLVDKNIADL